MNRLFNLIFPKVCVGCDGEGSWLCDRCFETIVVDAGSTSTDSQILAGLLTVSRFDSGVLREAIHHLKYNGVPELAVPLGMLLAKRLKRVENYKDWLVVPIAAHHHRVAERGYNQAELLAMVVARELGLVVETQALIRYRKTVPQVTLPNDQRRTNLQSVFAVRKKRQRAIEGRTVVLIDDVTTTGTTLEEAATVLLKAGVKEVYGLVLAKVD